jgi:asparagine synthase (glutamine-hydrolysing)
MISNAPHFQSEWLVSETPHWAVGRIHLGTLQPGQQLSPDARVQALLHGDLVEAGTGQHLAPAGTGSDRLREAYRAGGLDAIAKLQGAYCGVLVDTERHDVVLVADTLSSYPLYWTVAGDTFIFASELRALLRHPAVRRGLDPRALADYLVFGFPLGTKTMAAGVQMVPAGSAVVFNWDSGAVRTAQLTRIADSFGPWKGNHGDYISALSDQFRLSVERAFDGDHPFGLSLSGGLDSRAVLSAAGTHASCLSTYTLGVRGCADQVIAEHLARLAGTRHTFFELNDSYLRDFLPNLRELVVLTDGMYLSHGLTEMLALGFLRKADFRVLQRGHGGELAKVTLAWPLHTDEQIYSFSSKEQFIPYLLQRVNYISPGLRPADLFTDEWARQIDGAALTSLRESLADVELSPPNLCSYLYLTEHHRRFTIPSLELFRQAVEVRMPFVDTAFLDILFKGDPRWRDGTTIHRALTLAGDPRLLKVRNSNTGAPGDASPLVESVLDKFNTLFKRLNVHGYRHYHNFQAWMQAQLLSSVESVLLSKTSLDRGIWSGAGIQRLLDDTRHRRADHSYLLQVLLLVELWQQENL